MKIKKFNNLWTMGLIIFGAILVALYLLKIVSPKFVIKVAEQENIVKFGTYVDTHKWAYYLFYGFVCYFTMVIYTCACCKIIKLDIKELLILLVIIIVSFIIERYKFSFSLSYNFMAYIFTPLIIVYKRKVKDFSVFYSTCICFLITTLAQWLSLEIRDISTLISYPNTATFFILVLDGTIWNVLLYLFYNYKKGECNNG